MRVIIIGAAGIGGPSAALSPHWMGFRDILVLERVREIKPLGIGLAGCQEDSGPGKLDRSVTIGCGPSASASRHGEEQHPYRSGPFFCGGLQSRHEGVQVDAVLHGPHSRGP
jgi:hypothetical protein